MTRSVPINGADAFLNAIERMMLKAGQGRHLGVTVLRLGVGFDSDRFRAAVTRLADASPIAAARLITPLFQVPRWEWSAETRAVFPVIEHSEVGDFQALCEQRLNSPATANVGFDLVHTADGGRLLLVHWRHLILDGKGVELLLLELARLADQPDAVAHPESWGAARFRKLSWRDWLAEAGRFKDRFYEYSRYRIQSLGRAGLRAGAARFRVEEFSREETTRIAQRAESVSRGVFQLGWFLAAATRAHRALFLQRGIEPESYQSGCSVQERKRGSRHPIWQNQVSQIFFCLPAAQAADLNNAAMLLQEQFAKDTRLRMHQAFATMSGALRRIPAPLYLRLLRANSGGCLTSFFFSHTGKFLPECNSLAGAPLLQGWHVPAVCAPPGTGLFFSERDGSLTVSFSWRDGVITEQEVELMRATLRQDLLGNEVGEGRA